MDGIRAASESTAGSPEKNGRRRRFESGSENIRYFLPKPGGAADRPELGEEFATEGEALVRAFKSGQIFYTLVAWNAVPEMNGNEPKIVKQAVSRD